MATHKSAEKRARQAVRRNKRNTESVSAVRTFEKKIRAALAGGDAKSAQTLLSDYVSRISKAARKGTVHAKTASRKISRISERIHKIGAPKQA